MSYPMVWLFLLAGINRHRIAARETSLKTNKCIKSSSNVIINNISYSFTYKIMIFIWPHLHTSILACNEVPSHADINSWWSIYSNIRMSLVEVMATDLHTLCIIHSLFLQLSFYRISCSEQF